jgi:hypothetical protein
MDIGLSGAARCRAILCRPFGADSRGSLDRGPERRFLGARGGIDGFVAEAFRPPSSLFGFVRKGWRPAGLRYINPIAFVWDSRGSYLNVFQLVKCIQAPKVPAEWYYEFIATAAIDRQNG